MQLLTITIIGLFHFLLISHHICLALQPSTDLKQLSMFNKYHPNYLYNTTIVTNDTAGSHNNHHENSGGGDGSSSSSTGKYTLLIVGAIVLFCITLGVIIVRFRRYKESRLTRATDNLNTDIENSKNSLNSRVTRNLSIDSISMDEESFIIMSMERGNSPKISSNKQENNLTSRNQKTDLSLAIIENNGNENEDMINNNNSNDSYNNSRVIIGGDSGNINGNGNNGNVDENNNEEKSKIMALKNKLKTTIKELPKNVSNIGNKKNKNKNKNGNKSLINPLNAQERANNGLVIDETNQWENRQVGQFEAIIT